MLSQCFYHQSFFLLIHISLQKNIFKSIVIILKLVAIFIQFSGIDMQKQQITLKALLVPGPITERGNPSILDVNSTHLLYFNGSTVIVKPLNSDQTPLVTYHKADITIAKFSNDGKLIASIDSKGTLAINQLAKDRLIQYKIIEGFYAGAKSIDWSLDRKKIVVVGSGKNKFGRVISIQSQTDIGQITGVSANLNTVAYHPKKMSRIVTGGDEYTIKIYQGPPFKFIKSQKTHTGYIYQIKYSPDGKYLVSVGADRRIVLYDGESTEKIAEKIDAHNGGIMGIDWIDDKTFVTVSTDKTIRVWNEKIEQIKLIPVANEQQLKNFKFIQKCLVATRYHNNKLYSVCLNGDIIVHQNILETQTSSSTIISYKNKPIQTIQIGMDKFLLLDNYGKILVYNIEDKSMVSIQESRDIKLIIGGATDTKNIYVLLGDNTVLWYDLESYKFIKQTKIQNARMITANKYFQGFAIATNSNIQWHSHQKIQKKITIDYEPSFLTCNKQVISVGSIKGNIYLYNTQTLEFICTFNNSPNKVSFIRIPGRIVYVGDSTGKVKAWVFDGKEISNLSQDFGTHTSIITSICLLGSEILCFGMDCKMSITDSKSYKRLNLISELHRLGIVSSQIQNKKIITCGGDLLLKIWEKN